jgi:hypothetical protein
MTTRILIALSAALEAATGASLIVDPYFMTSLLLGVGISSGGAAVGRIGGFALLSLGLACWPGRGDASAPTIRALFTYNLLAALYLGSLRVGGGFISSLLWPASALHTLLAILLARATYEGIRRAGNRSVVIKTTQE